MTDSNTSDKVAAAPLIGVSGLRARFEHLSTGGNATIGGEWNESEAVSRSRRLTANASMSDQDLRGSTGRRRAQSDLSLVDERQSGNRKGLSVSTHRFYNRLREAGSSPDLTLIDHRISETSSGLSPHHLSVGNITPDVRASPPSSPSLSTGRRRNAPPPPPSRKSGFAATPSVSPMHSADNAQKRATDPLPAPVATHSLPTVPARPSKSSQQPVAASELPSTPLPASTAPGFSSALKETINGPPHLAFPSNGSPTKSALMPPPPRRTPSPSLMPPKRLVTAAAGSSDMTAPPAVSSHPPPPSRTIPSHERLAPQRPSIAAKTPPDSGGSSSSSDENTSSSKSQDFPDAAFANRRPPLLPCRRTIRADGQYYSVAVRNRTIVTGQHHIYVWDAVQGGPTSGPINLPAGEHKVHALEFRPAAVDAPADDARFVWGGTKDGDLFEADLTKHKLSGTRLRIHTSGITSIHRLGRSMITIDDGGKVLIFGDKNAAAPPLLSSTPRTQRLLDRPSLTAVLGEELWTFCNIGGSRSGTYNSSTFVPHIRVYSTHQPDIFALTSRPLEVPDFAAGVGAVTAATVVHTGTGLDLVYLGHETGYVSIWNKSDYACIRVQRVSAYSIVSLLAIGTRLWAGFRTGFIHIYDISSDSWSVLKAWRAHDAAVLYLLADPASLWTDSSLPVMSAGSDLALKSWDGFLRQDWIDNELRIRQTQFCDYRTIKILMVSWNAGASSPSDASSGAYQDFISEALNTVQQPDIIVFGFQEVIDLNDKKLTAKSLLLGLRKIENRSGDSVSPSYKRWHEKLQQSVRQIVGPNESYNVAFSDNLVGLCTSVFVKDAEFGKLRDIALATVKTGMKGRYGNKGAIICRFVVSDTSICFLNCHLAAGQSHARQRDRGLITILEGKGGFSDFHSSSPEAYAFGGLGDMVFDHELIFLGGDLNYRIDLGREAVLTAVENKNVGPLVAADQLLKRVVHHQNHRLRSFAEAPIAFMPTYKYDPGTDDYDTSDLPEKVTPLFYRRHDSCKSSDHRPISAAFEARVKVVDQAKKTIVYRQIKAEWESEEAQLMASFMEHYHAML